MSKRPTVYVDEEYLMEIMAGGTFKGQYSREELLSYINSWE